jgi:hypothetical protein
VAEVQTTAFGDRLEARAERERAHSLLLVAIFVAEAAWIAVIVFGIVSLLG